MLDVIGNCHCVSIYTPLGDEPKALQVSRHSSGNILLSSGITSTVVRHSLHLTAAEARALGEALIQMAGGGAPEMLAALRQAVRYAKRGEAPPEGDWSEWAAAIAKATGA